MRIYFAITAAAVALVPLSVTGSQTLMALSLLWGMALLFFGRASAPETNGPTIHPGQARSGSANPRYWSRIKGNPAASAGWFLVAYLALVYGIRSLQYLLDSRDIFQPRPFHNELTDFFLFLFAWLAFLHAQRNVQKEPASQSESRARPGTSAPSPGAEQAKADAGYEGTGKLEADVRSPAKSHLQDSSAAEQKERIYAWILNGLTAFAILTVLSGLLAMFTEIRLSKLFTGHGHEFSAANRPQFVFRSFGEFTLYRPIGFMNTRLSYAGILLFSFSVLFHRGLTSLKTTFRSVSPASLWVTSLWLLLCGIGLLALLMNGSRSGQIGSAVTIGLILLYHIRGWWAMLPLRKKELPADPGPGVRKWTVGAPVLLLLLLGALYIYGLQSGTHRHTDYMRPVIWKGALSLFQEHPFLGVGPGNYPDAFHEWARHYYLDHPRTMYFLEITPDSHAHNDLLHLLALGGLPAGLAFLALIFFSVRSLASLWSSRGSGPMPALEWALRSAAPGFFVAGLSQCYFQDDEVVVVFWTFLFAAEILKRMRR